jgi:hypothetical protein
METLKGTRRGLELDALLQLLAEQKEKTRDYVTNASALTAENHGGKLAFRVNGAGTFNPTGWAFSQLCGESDIPKQYADRLKTENPELLARNLNHGLAQIERPRIVRTVGDTMRALVSDRYFPLDAFDLLRETLPAMFDGGFRVERSEISDRRLYVRAVSPRTTTEVSKGDAVQFGISLSTSDVGGGALKVEPFFYRLACLNGMVIEENVLKRGHVTARASREILFESDAPAALLTSETREKKAAAIYSEARDIIRGFSNVEVFRSMVDRMRDATARPISNTNVEQVVARAMSAASIVGKDIQADIIKALVNGNQGAGFTQWGLANSFTAQAHTTEDADKADALMRAGGRIITLTDSEWRSVAA